MDSDIDINSLNGSENSEENDDEVELTPAEVIELMEEAWINEKFAPEILPHKLEVVDILLGQISHMELNLKGLAGQGSASTDFKKTIHQLEVDRLRFLVSSYLRIRLEKIETYVMHILEQEDQRILQGTELYLTEHELKFAREYSEGLQQHFENVTSVYPTFPREDWSQETIKPNIHSFVFLKSKGDVESVVIDDGKNAEGDLVDLSTGSQVIISYKSVANLVKNGDVQLI